MIIYGSGGYLVLSGGIYVRRVCMHIHLLLIAHSQLHTQLRFTLPYISAVKALFDYVIGIV